MDNGRTVLVFGAALVAGVIAGTAAADAQAGGAAAPAAAAAGALPPGAAPALAPTPRDADGHPILAGLWTRAAGGVTATAPQQTYTQNYNGRGGSFVGLEADGGLRRETNDNRPLYKPEYWDQVTDNEYQGNFEDPVDSCLPVGVPRLAIPAQIIKVEGQPAYALMYQTGFTGYGGSYESWDVTRWVWADGRPHNVNYAASETAMGDSTAHWEGDTLVVESVGFTDDTWLHKNGWIHGFDMKVTERLTRVGNELVWEATVDDPQYFQQPWKLTPVVAVLGPNQNGILGESQPCEVREPFGSHVRSG
jgi:hypothetical protein